MQDQSLLRSRRHLETPPNRAILLVMASMCALVCLLLAWMFTTSVQAAPPEPISAPSSVSTGSQPPPLMLFGG